MSKRKNGNQLKGYWKATLDKASVRQWILAILTFVGLFGLLVINLLPTGIDAEVGQVSRRDVVAPRTIVNREQTEALQEEAARRAIRDASDDPSFYDINHATIIKVEERMDGVIAVLRQGIAMEETEGDLQIEIAPEEPLSQEDIDHMLISDWQVEIPQESLRVIINAQLSVFENFANRVKGLVLARMETRIGDADLESARDQFQLEMSQTELPLDLRRAGIHLGQQFIQPNLVLDTQKVAQARQDAIRSVEPVTIQKGEVIVRRGDVVRSEHIRNLQDLGLHRTGPDYLALIGLAILLFLMLAALGVYLHQFLPNILASEGRLALVGAVIIVVSFIAKILALIQWPEASLLFPIALASILLTVLLDARLAIISTIILAVVTAVVNNFDLNLLILALSGGFAGVFSISRVSQRSDLMRAGFVVGAINFVSMIALGLLQREYSLIIHSYLGILNGVFASIIAIGFLPYFESLFGLTSSIRLLELSNPNHPLLRRLLMEAPGTYHHSILVGNLSEAAADSVGADGLLARVGSHYHDIGKLKRPYFFVENQVGMDNPHDKIAPSLSTLIIISHVKDGVELAREYKLPDVISAFVGQHHGTDLVKFFFHKATETGNDNVEEKDFRYQGPKPQTRETAIVSLADAVEAAVRSLSKPTPGKIEGLVRKIVRDRLNCGELDECDLTLKDLDKITNSFVKVLIGMFHARVEYPEQITKEEIEGKRNRGGHSHQ